MGERLQVVPLDVALVKAEKDAEARAAQRAKEEAENAAAMAELREMGLFQDVEGDIPELPNNALEVAELDSDHVEVLEDPNEHADAEPPIDLPMEALEPVETAVKLEEMSDQEREALRMQARFLRNGRDPEGNPYLTVPEGQATRAQVEEALARYRADQEELARQRALADAK